MEVGQLVVEEARKYLGVRWRHQSRTEYSLDCVGLIVKVAHNLNMSNYDMTDYNRSFSDILVSVFKQHMVQKKLKQRQEGDVLLMKDRNYPTHVGILSIKDDKEYLIHSSNVRGCVLEELLEPLFKHVTHCFSWSPGMSSRALEHWRKTNEEK